MSLWKKIVVFIKKNVYLPYLLEWAPGALI